MWTDFRLCFQGIVSADLLQQEGMVKKEIYIFFSSILRMFCTEWERTEH